MYTIKDLLDMSAKELEKELAEARKTYVAMNISVKVGKEKNTAELRKQRRYVAQIQTVMNNQDSKPAEKVEPAKVAKKAAKKANK